MCDCLSAVVVCNDPTDGRFDAMTLLSNGWLRRCAVVLGSCLLIGCSNSTNDDSSSSDAASGDVGKSDAAGGGGGAQDSGVEAEASVGGSGGVSQGGAGGSDASGGSGASTGGAATGGGGQGGSGGSAGNGGSTPNPCNDIAQIGDSLSVNQETKIIAAYSAQGMTVQSDALGGRAVLQASEGNTGLVAAQRFLDKGFKGCWVVALGTNDTAKIAAGAKYTRASAIDQMMTKIDSSKKIPVMWVNTYTTKTTGNYVNGNMILWNEELEKAKSRWPNMRVYDWATVAKTGVAPFVDGVHHTSAGQDVRHASVAKAAKELLGGP